MSLVKSLSTVAAATVVVAVAVGATQTPDSPESQPAPTKQQTSAAQAKAKKLAAKSKALAKDKAAKQKRRKQLAKRVMPMGNYHISAIFRQAGPHTGGVHGGLDFGAPEGRRIRSVCAGKVVQAAYLGNAGNSVVVKTHSNKLVLYGHMSKIAAKKGQRVLAGDTLGYVGSTGNSTGPHLHLQVNLADGSLIDPLRLLNKSLREVKRLGRD